MARIACLLADGFDDFAYREAVRTLADAGYDVEIPGTAEGTVLHGQRGVVSVKVDQHINKVVPGSYHAVLIPGGPGTERLCEDARFAKLVGHLAELGRPIFALAEGPLLLLEAGILREGRALTAAPPIQDRLRETGAEVLHRPVVVDGSWVTARQTSDLPQFCELMRQVLEGQYPASLPPPNRTGPEAPHL